MLGGSRSKNAARFSLQRSRLQVNLLARGVRRAQPSGASHRNNQNSKGTSDVAILHCCVRDGSSPRHRTDPGSSEAARCQSRVVPAPGHLAGDRPAVARGDRPPPGCDPGRGRPRGAPGGSVQPIAGHRTLHAAGGRGRFRLRLSTGAGNRPLENIRRTWLETRDPSRRTVARRYQPAGPPFDVPVPHGHGPDGRRGDRVHRLRRPSQGVAQRQARRHGARRCPRRGRPAAARCGREPPAGQVPQQYGRQGVLVFPDAEHHERPGRGQQPGGDPVGPRRAGLPRLSGPATHALGTRRQYLGRGLAGR